ncbi:3-hydroxyacyl-CoA dehydrogenase NAD-binding domain-containing protein [Sphingobium sp. HBC34]|uniref:3-hydroxyacyl-CoA dehydrogenase NAD-binding domain-containing protein n=1 Tax=Sphingobium cyanobacteriorum TaxID=3063954 RepID=A0ABT8ZP58_9SPHN|nr:3-hydroxyacyl-CoA dehydrogenase NAD-binding domain-containing protein [Sphingobium sp. HBC34]MDO7836325.1 3-hydroxyacyl-CoA dehydrogenase NAD-binding domain-containing protein [Sphingobium sp. HBC34]
MAAADWVFKDGIAVVTISNPPVGALSLAVRRELGEALARAGQDDAVRAVILTGSHGAFSAGGDIKAFNSTDIEVRPYVKDLQAQIASLAKPVIAAIDGIALGGGLELALACHGRVATPRARLSLPELKLGMLPGAAGVVQMTHLIGPERTLDLLVSGRVMSAEEALADGIVDMVEEDALAAAEALARAVLDGGRVFVPVLDRPVPGAPFDPALADMLRQQAARKARGAEAPVAAAEVIAAACAMDVTAAVAFNEQRAGQLYGSPQQRAQTYYFKAERAARRVPGLPEATRPAGIAKAAVIGSGTMGGGIAMVFANAGIPVTLVDISQDALDRGMGIIARNYDTSVKRGSMTQEKADMARARISGTTDYEAIADVDIAVEAVFEKMDLKQSIFRRLDAVLKPGAILATNTSSLDIDAIAAVTGRPQDVIGVHFFSPANIMKLQENVRGTASSPRSVATVMALGKALGKVPVLAGNCDGFIGNRMLQYYQGEAEFMLEQGAGIEQIDRVAERFGMPMGPLAICDLAGVDVGVLIYQDRAKRLAPGNRQSPIAERLLAMGRLGQKNGKGFYRYEGRERIVDQEVVDAIAAVSAELGITRRDFTDEEIEARLFMPLVNEGAKELEDGTALRASDIDVVWVNGYGFPTHKGGPMYWGEQVGLEKVRDMALSLAERNGPRWGPSALLERLVREGKGWADA